MLILGDEQTSVAPDLVTLRFFATGKLELNSGSYIKTTKLKVRVYSFCSVHGNDFLVRGKGKKGQ